MPSYHISHYGTAMLLTILVSLLSAQVAVSQSQSWTTSYPSPQAECLNPTQVDHIVSASAATLGNTGIPPLTFNETIAVLFTSDFQGYSDSEALLLGLPIDQQPLITSREQILQAPRPGVLGLREVQTLSVLNDCSRIFWRWTAEGNSVGGKRISGFHELNVEWVDDVPIVAEAWYEFDSGVFLV
jgi:hypothetical protein